MINNSSLHVKRGNHNYSFRFCETLFCFYNRLFILNFCPEKRAVFLKSLDDVIGEEKGIITLACEASKPRVSPIWRKDGTVLKAGPKYELLHTGRSLGLIIKEVTKEDQGEYTCDLGTEVSKAKVTVRGRSVSVLLTNIRPSWYIFDRVLSVLV